MNEENVKKAVREGYARIAVDGSCCSASVSKCCGQKDLPGEISSNIGYTEEDIKKVPEGSNLGLGCGNPVALASLKKGDTVLDLGSGAGFDCFLAANKVGPEGKVIGVDMTPEMIEKARGNAEESEYDNVEFRLGEIENLPIADGSIDIVISNCVINLAPDKEKVFKEAFRVLKPGGRIMVSDMVLTEELPGFIKDNISAYVSCISGAIIKDEYLNTIKSAGFRDIEVLDETDFPINYIACDDTATIIKKDLDLTQVQTGEVEKSILSIKVSAIKPKYSI